MNLDGACPNFHFGHPGFCPYPPASEKVCEDCMAHVPNGVDHDCPPFLKALVNLKKNPPRVPAREKENVISTHGYYPGAGAEGHFVGAPRQPTPPPQEESWEDKLQKLLDDHGWTFITAKHYDIGIYVYLHAFITKLLQDREAKAREERQKAWKDGYFNGDCEGRYKGKAQGYQEGLEKGTKVTAKLLDDMKAQGSQEKIEAFREWVSKNAHSTGNAEVVFVADLLSSLEQQNPDHA
jgi:hypothetical protein